MERNYKNYQPGFLIFTFNFDIMLLEVYHVYIRCTYNNIIIRAHNIDDLYYTGWINPPGMVKIVTIVCTCKLNNIIANYNIIPYSRVIRRMRLYLHRKKICAYKRVAPNKEQRLNSSTCDVHAYSARPMQTTPYIITI